MGNHDRSRLSQWAGLLLLASTTSALTLSNFQLITSSGVPIACILVYNTVIPGCTTDDFTLGNACSAACANGVARVQSTVQGVCDGVDASASSVLGQALQGNLVNLLCPDVAAATSQTSKQTATTSTALTTTSSTTSNYMTTLTPVVSSTAASTALPTLATDLPPVVPSFVQSESRTPLAPTQTTGAQQSAGPPQPTTDVPLGGVNPFDATNSGGSRQPAAGWVPALSVALGFGLLLLR